MNCLKKAVEKGSLAFIKRKIDWKVPQVTSAKCCIFSLVTNILKEKKKLWLQPGSLTCHYTTVPLNMAN